MELVLAIDQVLVICQELGVLLVIGQPSVRLNSFGQIIHLGLMAFRRSSSRLYHEPDLELCKEVIYCSVNILRPS